MVKATAMILAVFLVLSLSSSCGKRKMGGVTDTSSSPFAELKSVDIDDVRWTEGFWSERHERCRTATIPAVHKALLNPDNAAYLNNFRYTAGLEEGEWRGTDWGDGDCYKFLETCAYMYALTGDKKLDELMDEWIEVIGLAQAPDGYISTNIQLGGKERFTRVHNHEMYNIGHLLNAACIHHRATGKENFLRIAQKLGDYLYATFVPTPPELLRFGWNPSQIMGLVELYRTTRDKKYLEIAETFVNNRGAAPAEPGASHAFGGTDQTQDRVPLREETGAVGHAVTGMYLWCGAADVCAETGEEALMEALETIWLDVTSGKMDITGSVGYGNEMSKRGDPLHEAFGHRYQLPNRYNETCSNIGNAMWNWRMLALTGEAGYADVMEKVVYNSFLSAVDLQGEHFFYCNPMSWDGRKGRGHHTGERWSILDCYCCPPSVSRTLAKLHGWFYSVSDKGLWVHLYGGNRLSTELPDGSPIALRQTTEYPWQGWITIELEKAPAQPTAIMVRIPGWAEKAAVEVNGKDVPGDIQSGTYLELKRTWKKGDVIQLDFPMTVKLMEAHPAVQALRGKVAVTRGPVVYCLEVPVAVDGEKMWQQGIYLPENIQLQAEYEEDFLGGLVVLKGKGLTEKGKNAFARRIARVPASDRPAWQEDMLYRDLAAREIGQQPESGTVDITLIPYHAWANRGLAYMDVWIPLARR